MQIKPQKIKVKMPCKCIIEVDTKNLDIQINKYFINKIECKKHGISGKYVFLKKISDDLYKAILDPKKERKIFKEEDNFFVEMYNIHLFDCKVCGTKIYGKHMLSVNHQKRTYWEIDYKCPECEFTGMERVDVSTL